MSMVTEIDYGTPASRSEKAVALTIDGVDVRVPEGTSIMRAAMEVGTKIPKLCATDMLKSFGSCRLCLVEIEGRAGTPASCTTPVAPGMIVYTQTDRLKALRKGVMELYISDHPLDCLTCAANGNCELQTEAGNVGLRDVRYGYEGANHLTEKKDESNPYFSYDRRNASFATAAYAPARKCKALRADDRRARLREPGFGRASGALPRIGMRLLRRLRPGLPDRHAHRKVGHRDWPGRTFGGHDLRLLRCRLQLQGRNARRGARPHGSLQGRQAPRALMCQGPLRLGLCEPQGSHSQADDPRKVSDPWREVSGMRPSPTRRPSSNASRRNMGRLRSAPSPPRAAPMKRPTSSKNSFVPVSATTMSILARGFAIPRPAMALGPRSVLQQEPRI